VALATFQVLVEGRLPFTTPSVLLARAYSDLHDLTPGSPDVKTLNTGGNWPQPRDPAFKIHRTVRRSALQWKVMDRAIRRFDEEVQSLLPTAQTDIRDLTAYALTFSEWLPQSRKAILNEIYRLNGETSERSA